MRPGGADDARVIFPNRLTGAALGSELELDKHACTSALTGGERRTHNTNTIALNMRSRHAWSVFAVAIPGQASTDWSSAMQKAPKADLS
jgi:hypothetical protein